MCPWTGQTTHSRHSIGAISPLFTDNTKLTDVPGSFKDLIEADENLKIVIQDPRSSTPGLGLLMWVENRLSRKSR